MNDEKAAPGAEPMDARLAQYVPGETWTFTNPGCWPGPDVTILRVEGDNYYYASVIVRMADGTEHTFGSAFDSIATRAAPAPQPAPVREASPDGVRWVPYNEGDELWAFRYVRKNGSERQELPGRTYCKCGNPTPHTHSQPFVGGPAATPTPAIVPSVAHAGHRTFHAGCAECVELRHARMRADENGPSAVASAVFVKPEPWRSSVSEEDCLCLDVTERGWRS